MYRIRVLTLPVMLAAAALLHADMAGGDPRKEKLFGSFIAPCCWRENLLVHHSPLADEMRAEIEQMVTAGRSDDEIRQVFVQRHTVRVLAMPEGVRRQWLMWMPVLMLLVGAGLVVRYIGRKLRPAAAIVTLSVLSLHGEWRRVDPPAQPGSGMPHLTSGADGAVYLTWTEPADEKEHALRFAQWNGSRWTEPETIMQGRNWFVNWGDFGSLSVSPKGWMLAHWLARSQEGSKYGYGIHVARRDPAQPRWREIHGMSIDEKSDYAGFLAFAPGAAGAIYLSPPQDKHSTAAHEEHSHRKTVRFVSFLPDGSPGADLELDSDACSCCPTAIGKTRSGLVAAYRDHLPGEIRDISVVRFIDGVWTKPRTLHPDGWRINGCPTDGPSLVSSGSNVAITWLTRANGEPKIQVSFSKDEGRTFGQPVRIDGGNALGRPSIAALDSDRYLIAWLEKSGESTEVRMRRVAADGKLTAPIKISQAPPGRAAGFPKIAVSGEQVLLAWRDERVRAALLTKSQIEEQK